MTPWRKDAHASRAIARKALAGKHRTNYIDIQQVVKQSQPASIMTLDKLGPSFTGRIRISTAICYASTATRPWLGHCVTGRAGCLDLLAFGVSGSRPAFSSFLSPQSRHQIIARTPAKASRTPDVRRSTPAAQPQERRRGHRSRPVVAGGPQYLPFVVSRESPSVPNVTEPYCAWRFVCLRS
jgi:hypothetical protein